MRWMIIIDPNFHRDETTRLDGTATLTRIEVCTYFNRQHNLYGSQSQKNTVDEFWNCIIKIRVVSDVRWILAS